MHTDIEKSERGYCSLWQKKNKESSLCAMHLCQSQLVPRSLPGTSSGILQHKAALLPCLMANSSSVLLLLGADTNTQQPRGSSCRQSSLPGSAGLCFANLGAAQTAGRFTKCSLSCTFTHLNSPGRLTMKTMTRTQSSFSC